jgi:hypothetical protein
VPEKEPFAKGRRLCPFCGGSSQSRSSGEHIWPAWAGPLLPIRAIKREHCHTGWEEFETVTEIKRDYTRQGSPSAIKARGPCKKCNETWMSRLEDEAKPAILALTQGFATSLNRKHTRILAQWIFLKFCIISCQDAEIWCVSELDRMQFMVSRTIPRRFSAWVFKHKTQDWYDRYLWFSTRAYQIAKPETFPDLAGPHNANTFAFGFGRILFLCVFQWGIRIDTGFSRKHAAKLWPMKASGGLVLPELELDEDEVNSVARLLPLINEGVD